MEQSIANTNTKKILVGVMATLFLTACGGDGDKKDQQNPPADNNGVLFEIQEEAAMAGVAVEQSAVQTLAVKDADNNNLAAGTVITLSYQMSTEQAMVGKASLTDGVDLLVNDDGVIVLSIPGIDGLPSGSYLLKMGDTVILLHVGDENFNSEAGVAFPVSWSGTGYKKVDGIVATISGVVTNSSGNALAGVQVGLSGGSQTGGVFVSTTTDDKGQYTLHVNAGSSLQSALLNANIIATAPGFESTTQPVSVTANEALTGVNVQMQAVISTTALFRETFESNSSTAALWTVQACKVVQHDVDDDWWDDLFNEDFDWSDFEQGYSDHHGACDPVGVDASQPHWQIRGNNTMVNSALSNSPPLVRMAPNDQSAGRVPAPAQGVRAFWYGDAGKGNFLGDSYDTQEYSGGTSNGPNAGVLTSPLIDIPANIGHVSLTFMNWWEIESVNPNANGFDLLTIQISTDDGATWESIARLNPLSDPVTGTDRAPTPFSNTGFNSAPEWRWQEPIALNGVAGKSIRIRFHFDTVDELYNGFRGWLIDDVRIIPQQGTAPLLSDSNAWSTEGMSQAGR